LASDESISTRFRRASHCSRARRSGLEAEDSSDKRRGFISERYCGCLEAAAEERRRRVMFDGVDAADEELEDAIVVYGAGMGVALQVGHIGTGSELREW
jgi:hypothetical protein